MAVLGYVRVSTDEQRGSRAGLDAQRASILAECKRRGWRRVEVIEDAGYSGKDFKRPGVQIAMEALKRGEAEALVVAKLDRLSRSMLDFTGLMAKAQKQSWALVALDCAVDTTTPAGEAMANVMATFAQFERRLISQRTKGGPGCQAGPGGSLGASSAASDEGGQPHRAGAREGQDPDGDSGWWPSTIAAVLNSTAAKRSKLPDSIVVAGRLGVSSRLGV